MQIGPDAALCDFSYKSMVIPIFPVWGCARSIRASSMNWDAGTDKSITGRIAPVAANSEMYESSFGMDA